jgi:hypothetical protein
MSAQRQYFLMNCINYPISLREEEILQFVGGGDPVARAYCYGRSVEIIEGEFRYRLR